MRQKWVKKLEDLPQHFTPIEESRRVQAAEAAHFEEKYGPVMTPRGRPKKGTIVAKSRMRSIRLKDDLWESIREHAKAAGLSPNAAVQLAVAEWVQRH